MEYNDNFILPPEEVIKKMCKDYQFNVLKIKAMLEQTEANFSELNYLQGQVITSLNKSLFQAEFLYRLNRSRYKSRYLKDLIEQNKADIKDFNLRCEVPKNRYIRTRRQRVPFCKALQKGIDFEADVIKNLLILFAFKKTDPRSAFLSTLITKRIKLLKELNKLYDDCK